MEFIKVSGHDGLVRDQNTGAIISLDDSAVEARRKATALMSCTLGTYDGSVPVITILIAKDEYSGRSETLYFKS
jgi:hypothetical protein